MYFRPGLEPVSVQGQQTHYAKSSLVKGKQIVPCTSDQVYNRFQFRDSKLTTLRITLSSVSMLFHVLNRLGLEPVPKTANSDMLRVT